MGGWFSAFRTDSGPTWYGDNRTSVVVDMTTVSIVFVFCIFFAAFLVIFPGIRRQRWISFLTVVLTLSVGALILVCIHYPSWHVGQVEIYSEFRSYSSERLNSTVGVKVGLKFCNITLRAAPDEKSSISKQKHHYFDYNERFHFTDVRSLQRELADSLHLGLPFPILTVVEYLSVDRAGFIWGRMYRLAGHYTCILLWTGFAMWLLQVLLLCLVPAYFSRCIFSVGVCLLLANLIYGVTCPHKLVIFFPGPNGETAHLSLRFGWCFWTILGIGTLSMVIGGIIRLLEVKGKYQLTTFLQSDFDEVTRSPRNLPGSMRDRLASTASFDTNASFNAHSRTSSTADPLDERDQLPGRHPKFFAQHKQGYGASLAPVDAVDGLSPSYTTARTPSVSAGQSAIVVQQHHVEETTPPKRVQTPDDNWKSVVLEMAQTNNQHKSPTSSYYSHQSSHAGAALQHSVTQQRHSSSSKSSTFMERRSSDRHFSNRTSSPVEEEPGGSFSQPPKPLRASLRRY